MKKKGKTKLKLIPTQIKPQIFHVEIEDLCPFLPPPPPKKSLPSEQRWCVAMFLYTIAVDVHV